MAKDLSGIKAGENGTELSPEQVRLFMWRDYFEFLLTGLDRGGRDNEWREADVWLKVAITEIEGDIMHLQCDQDVYTRWGDAEDLSAMSGNWRV